MTGKRVYTRSECAKLDDSEFGREGICMNKKNGINYAKKCADLNNTVKSVLPSECKSEGAVLGKPSVAFKLTAKGKKTYQAENGAIQLYTNNECKILKGNFEKLEDTLKHFNVPDDEILKAVKANGEEYGVCFNDNASYSIVCTAEQTSSLSSSASASAKSAIKDWLK